MQVTRVSMMSGITRTREIDVTEQQMADWEAGGMIQKVMANLSADDREFILTGVTAEEWDKYMSDEE